LIYNSFCFRKQ